MSISLIIPSLNSPIIDRVIEAVRRQDGYQQVHEIIVIGKDEAGLIPRLERVRLLDTGCPVLPGAARNLGIEATDTPLLIFLDSDCLPQPGWLLAHLAAHEKGHVVVGGSVQPTGSNYWSLSYNLAMFNEYLETAVSSPRSILPTLNLSIERKVIDSIGLIDETIPRSEDLDWTSRMNEAGFQPYFWTDACIEHQHNRTTAKAFWYDSYRTGIYSRQARLLHPSVLKTPFWLRNQLVTFLLSPFIAAGVTGRIILKHASLMKKHWKTLPAIYLSKLAWCWGAAKVVSEK